MNYDEEPVPLGLDTSVWGVQRDGKPFFDRVQTVEVSPAVVCLAGITHPVAPGAILNVQREDTLGQFRVVWVGTRGTLREGMVGLRRLELTQATRNILDNEEPCGKVDCNSVSTHA